MPSLCCLGKSADGKDLEKRPVAGGRLTEEEEDDLEELEEDDSPASGDLVMGDYPRHPSSHPLDPSPAQHPYSHYPGLWYPALPSETRSNGSERWCPPLAAASSSIARSRNRSQASLSPSPRVGTPLWEVSASCRLPERRLGPEAPSRRCLTPDPSRTLALGLGPLSGPRGAASPLPQRHCASCGRLQTGDFTRLRVPEPGPLSRDGYPPSPGLVVGFGLVNANTTSSSSSSPARLLQQGWAPTSPPPPPHPLPPHPPTRPTSRGLGVNPQVNERQLTGRVVYDARLHRAMLSRGGDTESQDQSKAGYQQPRQAKTPTQSCQGKCQHPTPPDPFDAPCYVNQQ
ncbi:protein enabled homolog [Chiloscyllium plagiosum]|uniref:protein enabled homolog n=1 Tax=Chiloscyllium plagiosum TaxID=36176 RepID=UPI001CB805BC|nr:protein enabled homolog [Chiloscyllium plagiosum]